MNSFNSCAASYRTNTRMKNWRKHVQNQDVFWRGNTVATDSCLQSGKVKRKIMKITERLLLKLYRLIKPWFLRLERYTLQAKQFALALENIKDLQQIRVQGTEYEENI